MSTKKVRGMVTLETTVHLKYRASVFYFERGRKLSGSENSLRYKLTLRLNKAQAVKYVRANFYFRQIKKNCQILHISVKHKKGRQYFGNAKSRGILRFLTLECYF